MTSTVDHAVKPSALSLRRNKPQGSYNQENVPSKSLVKQWTIRYLTPLDRCLKTSGGEPEQFATDSLKFSICYVLRVITICYMCSNWKTIVCAPVKPN